MPRSVYVDQAEEELGRVGGGRHGVSDAEEVLGRLADGTEVARLAPGHEGEFVEELVRCGGRLVDRAYHDELGSHRLGPLSIPLLEIRLAWGEDSPGSARRHP